MIDEVYVFGEALNQEAIDALMAGNIGPANVDQSAAYIIVTADTTITTEGQTLGLGGFDIGENVTLTVEGPSAVTVGDLAADINSAIDIGVNNSLKINGSLLPDIAAATLDVTAWDVTFETGSVYTASITADGNDLLSAPSTSVFVEPGVTLDFQIDGKKPFVAGTYDLIIAGGEEGLDPASPFSEVTGLGDYLASVVIADNKLTVTVAHPLHMGDADLNLTTDVRDFNVWNTNKFTSGTDWTSGDFDGNGVTDVRDFNVWNTNKFTSVGAPAPVGGQVPEPASLALLACGALALLIWRKRRV